MTPEHKSISRILRTWAV